MCSKIIAEIKCEMIGIVIVLIVWIVIITVLLINANNKNSAWYFHLSYHNNKHGMLVIHSLSDCEIVITFLSGFSCVSWINSAIKFRSLENFTFKVCVIVCVCVCVCEIVCVCVCVCVCDHINYNYLQGSSDPWFCLCCCCSSIFD